MIIYGANGQGKVCYDLAKSLGIKVEYLIDDNPAEIFLDNKNIYYPIPELINEKEIIVAIGNNSTRKKISEKLKNSCVFPILIHPTAFVSDYSTIEEGTVVLPNAMIHTSSSIGKHCIINSGSVVEHDCEIGNFVHVSPNATIAGEVKIGDNSHIGLGANILPGIKIGNHVTIGAGAVVLEDIPNYATVVGNPGRIIKYMTKEKHL